MTLSADDRRRLEEYLGKASRAEKDTALSSQESFFAWLERVGLVDILIKIVNLVWEKIKEWLGL